MKFRFIEYERDIYIVIGMGYDHSNICPEYFICVPLTKRGLFKASLQVQTIKIALDDAIEITSKSKLSILKVLYG